MLKAYKTKGTVRALRMTLVSDYLDEKTIKKYRSYLDCVRIATDLYISIYLPTHYPTINIDEYFNYVELMGIDLSIISKAREESFQILIAILETKYGIEYVDSER